MNETIEAATTLPLPAARKFPIEGTNLAKILYDEEYRLAFHQRLKRYNPMIAGFYKLGLLPLFGASRTVMLLTTRGRKSGKLRDTPIGYFRIGGVIHLFSAWGKRASWYQNLRARPEEVWIQVGMRKWAVNPCVLEDAEEIKRALARFIAESPEAARTLFGWEPGRDRMETADLSPIIEQVVIVRFEKK